MLTNNFSEIIAVVIDKFNKNSLDTFTTEEISSISLMTLGYLRLIKVGFNTPDDTKEPSDSVYTNLKGILNLLTTTQKELLDKIKYKLINHFNSDLDAFDRKLNIILSEYKQNSAHIMDTFNSGLVLIQRKIKKLKQEFKEALFEPIDGFYLATIIGFKLSSIIKEKLYELNELDPNKNIEELFRISVDHHFIKLNPFANLERINNECIAYVECSEFIDILI